MTTPNPPLRCPLPACGGEMVPDAVSYGVYMNKPESHTPRPARCSECNLLIPPQGLRRDVMMRSAALAESYRHAKAWLTPKGNA